MHLATHYAPGSFLKPCLIVDTVFTQKTRETALLFVAALNADHASEIAYRGGSKEFTETSEWIVMAYHETKQDAIDFHLSLTEHFHNGGSQEEWDEGWEPYLGLWRTYCPGAVDEDAEVVP
jgi:hypothetical protein